MLVYIDVYMLVKTLYICLWVCIYIVCFYLIQHAYTLCMYTLINYMHMYTCIYIQPTNHLDLEAVLWLQNYLLSYPHTILLVSHDRTFLNEVRD